MFAFSIITIVLIPWAIQLLKASRYTLRINARIIVEGEAYLAKGGGQDTLQSEVLDVVSDARVTLDVRAGVAHGDYKILRLIEDRRELMKIEEEKRDLENGLSELLLTIALVETK